MFTEPFFTTKVRHRGLGLAIVYRALWPPTRAASAFDRLPPFPDTGTTVHGWSLPLAAARPSVTHDSHATARAQPSSEVD